jgi:nucleotide-binding universal stress UspA family protein
VKKVGDPAHEIASHAGSHGYDLIVMGTHGHTALGNLVMGSVATKVLASSKVPVLFFR